MDNYQVLQVINTILLLLAVTFGGVIFRDVKNDIKENKTNWNSLKDDVGKIETDVKMIKKSVRIIAKETNVNIGESDD